MLFFLQLDLDNMTLNGDQKVDLSNVSNNDVNDNLEADLNAD